MAVKFFLNGNIVETSNPFFRQKKISTRMNLSTIYRLQRRESFFGEKWKAYDRVFNFLLYTKDENGIGRTDLYGLKYHEIPKFLSDYICISRSKEFPIFKKREKEDDNLPIYGFKRHILFRKST